MSDYKSIKDIDSLHSIIEKLYIENNNLIKENKLLLNEKELKNNRKSKFTFFRNQLYRTSMGRRRCCLP